MSEPSWRYADEAGPVIHYAEYAGWIDENGVVHTDSVMPEYTYGGCPEQEEVSTSGDKQTWDTGAQRDSQDGKPRPDFIDPRFLLRIGEHLRKGSERYGDFNFDKGIPSQRYMASLLRHVLSYYAGDRSEDHLSACFFNVQGIAMNEGTELDDLHQWTTGGGEQSSVF